MYSGMRSGRVLMIWPTLMKVAPSSRNRSTTTRPSQARRRSRPARRSQSSHQPTQNRIQCLPTRSQMPAARAARRQRGRGFADMPEILYYVIR